MKFKYLLVVFFLISIFRDASAQLSPTACPGCVYDSAQFGTNPSPFAVGLFPDSIVITQNAQLDTNVTYLLPQEANTGISIAPTATVVNVTILGVNASTPLPTGINVTCNKAPSCSYDLSAGRYGCVKICGLTTQAATNGWVQAQITVAGTGTAAGQTQTQQQNINFYYKILPDTTACHTVCFQNKINTGCDSATLGIFPGIDISCADPILNPCSFDWDFGNGTTGSGLGAQTATYTTPGAYPVSLTKKTQQLVITSAAISTVSGWSNICNFFGLDASANNYQLNITIGNNTFNTSGGGSGAATFSGLSDTVTNQAIGIVVQDNCALSTLTSSSATLTITGPGTYQWSVTGSNAATGSITVSEIAKDSITYVDSAYIYSSPDTPLITLSHDTICQGDSAYLSIGAQYAGYKTLWYINDSTFLTAFGDTSLTIRAYTSGNYSVKVTNPFTHCQAASVDVPLAVSGPLPFAATIYFDNSGNRLFLNPFLPSNTAVWYYDSVLVTGQNGQFLPNLGNGTYYAYVYPTGFTQCSLLSNIYTLNVSDGIHETPNDIANLSVYPNPNNGSFAVKVNILTPGSVSLKLTDMLGRVVYDKALSNQTGEVMDNINVAGLAKNVYTLEVTTDKGRATQKVVID